MKAFVGTVLAVLAGAVAALFVAMAIAAQGVPRPIAHDDPLFSYSTPR